MSADFEVRMAVLGPHLFEGAPLAVAARRVGVARHTATRWLTAYRTAGAAGLSRPARSDRDGHRMPNELHDLIEGLALRKPPPKVAQVHRAACGVAVERGWQLPSYEVVRCIVSRAESALLALAQHDPDVYRDGFELVVLVGLLKNHAVTALASATTRHGSQGVGVVHHSAGLNRGRRWVS